MKFGVVAYENERAGNVRYSAALACIKIEPHNPFASGTLPLPTYVSIFDVNMCN